MTWFCEDCKKAVDIEVDYTEQYIGVATFGKDDKDLEDMLEDEHIDVNYFELFKDKKCCACCRGTNVKWISKEARNDNYRCNYND